MGEDGIKSALEIAMEKISGLPELTPEEIARQKEKEFALLGEALCHRYLDGAIAGGDLVTELGKYREDRRRIVRRALVSSLCLSLQLEDILKADRAYKGIAQLLADKSGDSDEMIRNFKKIIDDFAQESQGKSREFEAKAREKIRKMGISGSAIRHNLKEDESWQTELRRIRQVYEPRLERLRNLLMRKISTEKI